jgi:hypothetical protein
MLSLIRHIDSCFDKADANFSRLPDEILNMDGMSGVKTRHLYNNLLCYPDVRYLEIGVWAGSSTLSALFGNDHVQCVAVDNFSEFGGPKEAFLHNVKSCLSTNKHGVHLVEDDCFAIDWESFPINFNTYLYDGGHTEKQQHDAITKMLPAMEDIFVLIIDDWSWPEVQKGTYMGIVDSKLKVLYTRQVVSTNEKNGYWNGVGVFVLQKNT